MKKTIFSITALLLLAVSCSLEERPYGTIDHEDFYQNEQQCEAALSGVYRIFEIFNSSFVFMSECCSDTWRADATTDDAFLNISPSNPGHGNTMWTKLYAGVMNANEAIYYIERSSLEPDVKARLAAEGRVLRGVAYYYLTSVFDGVPYYTCPVTSFEVQDSIRFLPRTDASEIRRMVYEDIEENALPYFKDGYRKRTSEVKGNRAGYALGLMIMAKCAMWNQDWDAALAPLDSLEKLYGDFKDAPETFETVYPLEKTQWRYKNEDESIFEIQHAWSYTGVQANGNLAQVLTPKFNDGLFDGVAMDGYGTSLPSWNGAYSNKHFARMYYDHNNKNTPTLTSDSKSSIFYPLPVRAKDFDPNANRWNVEIDLEAVKTLKFAVSEKDIRPIDRRALLCLGIGNLQTGEVFGKVKSNGLVWGGPKFWCPDLVQGYDSNNYNLFRYADAILMMAECHAMLDHGNEAVKYYNIIRTRAGVPVQKNFSGSDDMMTLIRAERARELCGEFTRKFDLVRWGMWYDQTRLYNDRLTTAAYKDNWFEYHQYYPIPDKQCALSGYAISNPAYGGK
ncbi:MAG: RagB/SusD family nutrient uptake outer membrane protein [Bacteroidales bacterium]|nr:RagB/SusD family nutrient uptake outer membrane protein [Bacteroidales bacterium]